MNILVTGGAGFIGTNLAEELVHRGFKVKVIDNLSISDCNTSYLKSLGVEVIVEDIGDYDKIKDHFLNVDKVFHLAAFNRAQRSIENPLKANKSNIKGTLNVLEASRQAGVKKFVFISSSSVYASREEVLQEDMRLAPPHPYGIGKLAGEHYCRVYHEIYGLNTVILRYFSVYGPRQLGFIDKAGVIAKFVHLISNNKQIEVYGSGQQKRNFTFVMDVVKATIAASEIEEAIGQVINVANEQELTILDIIKTMETVIRKKALVNFVPPLKGDPARNPACIDKAKKILKFSPSVSFTEGITKTVKWYNETYQNE